MSDDWLEEDDDGDLSESTLEFYEEMLSYDVDELLNNIASLEIMVKKDNQDYSYFNSKRPAYEKPYSIGDIRKILGYVVKKLEHIMLFLKSKGYNCLPNKYSHYFYYPYQRYYKLSFDLCKFYYGYERLKGDEHSTNQNLSSTYPKTPEEYYQMQIKEYVDELRKKPNYDVKAIEEIAKADMISFALTGKKPKRVFEPRFSSLNDKVEWMVGQGMKEKERQKEQLSENKDKWHGFSSYAQYKLWKTIQDERQSLNKTVEDNSVGALICKLMKRKDHVRL